MKSRFWAFMVLILMYAVQLFSADAITGTHSWKWTPKYPPSDEIWYYTNRKGTAEASDTFAATLNKRIYGPWEIRGRGGKQPAASYLQVIAAKLDSTADSLVGSYQLLPYRDTIPTLADTVAGAWVAACTTGPTIGVNKAIDISAKAGAFLVWRWNNISASAAYQFGSAYIGMKIPVTYNEKTE